MIIAAMLTILGIRDPLSGIRSRSVYPGCPYGFDRTRDPAPRIPGRSAAPCTATAEIAAALPGARTDRTAARNPRRRQVPGAVRSRVFRRRSAEAFRRNPSRADGGAMHPAIARRPLQYAD